MCYSQNGPKTYLTIQVHFQPVQQLVYLTVHIPQDGYEVMTLIWPVHLKDSLDLGHVGVLEAHVAESRVEMLLMKHDVVYDVLDRVFPSPESLCWTQGSFVVVERVQNNRHRAQHDASNFHIAMVRRKLNA